MVPSIPLLRRPDGPVIGRLRTITLDGFLPVAFGIALYLNWLMAFDGHFFMHPNGDSWGYLNFGLYRTAGYPLFTWLVKLITGDLRWLGLIQLNLMLLSYLLLALGVRALLKSWLAGMVVFVLLAIDGELLWTSYQLMAEALFVTVLDVHLALVLFLFRRFSLPLAILAGLALSAAILVRPAGDSFLAGVPFLVLLLHRHWRAVLFGLGGGAVSLLLLASSFNLLKHGVFSPQVYGGAVLISSVGYLIHEDPDSRYPDLTRAIDQKTGPISAHIRAQPFPHEHWIVSVEDGCAIFTTIFLEVWQTAIRTPGRSDDQYLADMVGIESTLAKEAILREPGAYLGHVFSYYYGIWRSGLNWDGPMAAVARSDHLDGKPLFAYYDKDDRHRLRHLFYEDPDTDRYFAERQDDLTLPDRLWAVIAGPVRVVQCKEIAQNSRQSPSQSPTGFPFSLRTPITGCVFLASIGFIAALLLVRRRSAAMNAMIYTSLILNGYYLFVAMIGNPQGRYAVVAEPMWAVVAVGAVVLGWRAIRSIRRTGRVPA